MKKRTVNEYLSIDIRKIRAIFKPRTAKIISSWTVSAPFGEANTFTSELVLIGQTLCLTNPFDGEEIRVSILLRKVHFGWRKYFQCPYCSRRCDILYFSPEDYGCRQCLELTYISVQESHKDDKLIQFLCPNMPLGLAKRVYREAMKSVTSRRETTTIQKDPDSEHVKKA